MLHPWMVIVQTWKTRIKDSKGRKSVERERLEKSGPIKPSLLECALIQGRLLVDNNQDSDI